MCRREQLLYHTKLATLKSEGGRRIMDRTDVEEEISHKYIRVIFRPFSTLNPHRQAISEPVREVANTAFEMENGETPIHYSIKIELVKTGGTNLERL